MYLESLWAIVEKETGLIVAGFSTQSAYTSEGRAKAGMKKKSYDEEIYEVRELVLKED